MSAGRICSRSVVIAGPYESVRDAARRMATNNVGCLLVLDDQEGLTGIVTDRDVAIRCVSAELDPATTPVSEIMTTPVEAVREETPIEEALGLMAAVGTRRVPVVDADDELVGILSLDDFLELLVEETQAIGRLLEKHEPTIP